MLGFERIGHLVTIAAFDRAELLNTLKISNKSFGVSFEDYVKSQVHLNLTDDLFNRPLVNYVKAYRYLGHGEPCYFDDACTALQWFYQDMADFLLNNPFDVKMHISVGDSLKLPEIQYNLENVRAELAQFSNNVSSDMVGKSRFPEILRKIKKKKELEEKKNSCAVAAVLLHEAASRELHKISMEGL